MSEKISWVAGILATAGAAAMLHIGSGVAGAATILVDLGGTNAGSVATTSPDNHGRYWNNLTDDTTSGEVTNAVDTDNHPTTVNINVTDAFVGIGAGGTTVSTIYPASATKDYFYVAPGAANSGALLVSDLTVGQRYDFTFYGSRTPVSDSRIADFKIGSQTVSLQTADNVDGTVSINDITPDANGKVTILVSAQAGQAAGHFGVLQISEVPEPGSLSLLGLGGLLLVRRRRK